MPPIGTDVAFRSHDYGHFRLVVQFALEYRRSTGRRLSFSKITKLCIRALRGKRLPYDRRMAPRHDHGPPLVVAAPPV